MIWADQTRIIVLIIAFKKQQQAYFNANVS